MFFVHIFAFLSKMCYNRYVSARWSTTKVKKCPRLVTVRRATYRKTIRQHQPLERRGQNMAGCFENGKSPVTGKNPHFNPEGWPVNKAYDPNKDLSVDKNSYYHLQNPNDPKHTVGVKKDLGYIGDDGCFHYYPIYVDRHI